MLTGLQRFKPGGSRKSHLFLSSLLWTFIGCLLLTRGVLMFFRIESYGYQLASLSLVTGTVKSFTILDKVARKSVARILSLENGTCLGAVYSKKTWGLVLCMSVTGVVLRKSSLPIMLLCFIYLAVGWSLLLSSRVAWRAWKGAK
ncbi:hypothetical protein [Desulforhopalus singaporensis]|uniref:Uncharacterized protein n=1 Tax=Desulforhopalus singaporensis TaxID=91360 RepID=A0A1H0MQY0_9BACT|nr:hypothetical protein [Desulforhopalus singaporensis]SDO82849.1 hypothetical protein SAMN05660330_01151 [Desulforhopalus singaporensis]